MKPQRRLKPGDKIPDFWTRDMDGREVDSREFTKHTLVVFLRYAGCPFCNLAIHRLSYEYKMLQKNGCEVVAFVQSSESNIEEYILERQSSPPSFSVVSDQQQDIYKLFGVVPSATKAAKYTAKNVVHWVDAVVNKSFTQGSIDGSAFMVPAYFLVDPNGVIRLADYDASFYEDEVFLPIYEQLTFSDALD